MASDTKTSIVIIGAGAAGLAAAISAAECAKTSTEDAPRITIIESARNPGAKILVSGGGRCNVTNAEVSAGDFCGGPSNIVRKILHEFDHRQTVGWFARLGVPLTVEGDGKYFPRSNVARTVLDGLLHRVNAHGIRLYTGTRVTGIRHKDGQFQLTTVGSATSAPEARRSTINADRLIVATGGLALPKSGSDGAGLAMARKLGHTIVPTTPALCPLILRHGKGLGGRFAEFKGISLDARLVLRAQQADAPKAGLRKIKELTGSLLFTHTGISGPVVLNMSRHWHRARLDTPDATLAMTMGLPEFKSPEDASNWLIERGKEHPRRTLARTLTGLLPERIATAMAGDEAENVSMTQLSRERRNALARDLTGLPLDVVDSRGYAHAEVSAGGIDLREIDAHTMQSRKVPNLYFCGEILDVDGRIGGFNFQWAWSTGYLAGRAAAGL